MNYQLSIDATTYPVEDVQTKIRNMLVPNPVGQSITFVSPVQLTAGQTCELSNAVNRYRLQVNTCLGFTFAQKFLVSGSIVR